MSKIHLDDILEQTGGCGRFQVVFFIIIHSMKCIVCFSMVAMVFCAAAPDWWCVDDLHRSGNSSNIEFTSDNSSNIEFTSDSALYKACTIGNDSRTCTKFVFGDSIKTVVTEWGLVCGTDWAPSMITSIQMAGVLLGNVVCGQLADLFGRKMPLFLSILSLVLLNVLAVLSTTWQMFATIRFFIGLAMGFELTVHYNLLSEFTQARWRTWVVAVPSWAIELALFSLTAYITKDWKYLHIATAAVGLPLLGTYWFVPESFRWYVAHDRVDEAEGIVKRVAKFNKKPIPDMAEVRAMVEEEQKQAKVIEDRQYTLLDLIKHRHLLKITLLLGFIWITLGLGGYGIQFGVQALSGNLYLNIFIIAVLGSPLQFLNIYLQNRFGRKKTYYLFYGLTAITALIVGVAPYVLEPSMSDPVSNGAALVALTAINAAWSPVQTITIETYPTVVRNIGYGLQNTMARVGAIIGPQLVFLDTKLGGLMYFICAASALASIFLMFPIEETNNTDLKDKIEVPNTPNYPALEACNTEKSTANSAARV